MTPIAIYKITNILNGKMYIGQTIDPDSRWQRHKEASSKCKVISAAIKKYGKENFEFKILCWCPDKPYANYVEQGLIKAHDTRRAGYNICVGGEGLGSGEDHPCFGRVHSEREKESRAAKMRGANNPCYGLSLIHI